MSMTKTPPLSHSNLCQLAVSWLRRSLSRGGPGCQISISEPRCGFLSGEIPDAIGFRAGVSDASSTLVEVKISRSDFLSDKAKFHRMNGDEGVGTFRYYMAPEGIIYKEDLPTGWGLVEVTSRKSFKVIAGHVLEKYVSTEDGWVLDNDKWKHQKNLLWEWSLLSRLVYRLGDANALQAERRAKARALDIIRQENSALEKQVKEMLREQIRTRRIMNHPEVQKVIEAVFDNSLEKAFPRRTTQQVVR